MKAKFKTELIDRLLRYVAVDTAAIDDSETYPSSPGQFELGNILANELREIGATDVDISEHGIVTATVEGNVEGAPTIALLAHLDTSPESPGCGIKPQIIESYPGGDLVLPGDPNKVIRVEETPQLKGMVGKTLITTDGTTLLGGDDKAGISVIMTIAQYLIANPQIPHSPIRIVFSCDEEIGKGAQHLDLAKIGAVAGYTLDGEAENFIEAETFSADMATITFQGKNIHPGLAKDRMINAIRLAGRFIDRLPWQTLSPERTEGMEGFIHPVQLEGGVDRCVVKAILRSFDSEDLKTYADLMQSQANAIMAEFPGCDIQVEIKRQYRNMREGIAKEPRVVEMAVKALERLGRNPEMKSIRGGTDGSALTEMGLPTPNLSTGMHNFHSPLEFVCVDEMVGAAEHVIELAKCWAEA